MTGEGVSGKAGALVGKTITRINLRARKGAVEVRVTGRWLVVGSSEVGGLRLGPSQVSETIPGNGGEVATDYLHDKVVLDRPRYWGSRKGKAIDGVALLVDADEERERKVADEMAKIGREFAGQAGSSVGDLEGVERRRRW